MIQSICGGHGWGELVVLMVVLGLEFYLGKTRRTKASSILELIVTLAILFFTFLNKRRNKNE